MSDSVFHVKVNRRQVLKGLGGLGLAAAGGELLAACSSGGTATPTPGAGGKEDFGGVNLKIFSGGYMQEYEKIAIASWSKRTGGNATVDPIPFGDRPTKLAGLIASRDSSYDVIYMYDGYMQRFGDRLLVDLTDAIGSENRRDFFKIANDTTTGPSGKQRSGPLYVDQMVMLYNKDYFTKAGAPNPPDTWEELFALTPKFKEMKVIPNALCFLTATYGNFYWTFFINSLFKVPILSKDKTQILFDNDLGLQSFKTIKAGLDAGFWDTASFTAADEHDIALLFNQGLMAMHLGWGDHWRHAVSKNVKDYKATIDPSVVGVKITPAVRTGVSGSVNGGESLGVSKFSKNQAAAISLVKELISPTTMKAAALSATGYPICRNSLVDDPEVKANFKISDVWKQQAQYNLDLHNAPYDLAPVMDGAMAKMVQGASAQDAFNQAVKGSKDAILKWLSA